MLTMQAKTQRRTEARESVHRIMVEEIKSNAKSTTIATSTNTSKGTNGTNSSSKDRRSRSRSPRPPSGSNKRSTSPMPKNRHRSKTPPPSVSVPSPPKPKVVPPYLGMSLEEAVSTLPLTRVQEYQDDDDFLAAVKRCVPSEFVLLASQDEISKAQEDYVAMEHYQLPPPDGRKRWLNSELAGSVATCALLQLMNQYPDKWVAGHGEPFSTLEILHELQERIKKCSNLDANPTISSSRPLGPPRFDEGVYAPYYVVPPQYVNGTRRALLIGCVTGEGKDLKGPLNDICNIQRFLVDHAGFQPDNVTILQDSPKVPPEQRPTKKNILQGFATLIKQSKPNDVNFIQFSGHGNRDYQNL
jgi:Caspase domain